MGMQYTYSSKHIPSPWKLLYCRNARLAPTLTCVGLGVVMQRRGAVEEARICYMEGAHAFAGP